ncbi:AAA family ATPase [Flavobacterium lindanitolerans]|uniref:AAA family ATPase n=1 Tax=Flavobacterium lindanitolerans TaxID=428988 RepID=UPI00235630D6|nr:AAA family ATPase [Flavobacterium lindanitolerans]
MEPSLNNINTHTRKQTNWYVITGGPGSGKTTTVNLLKERGYVTTFEHARHYLDTQRLKGKTVEEVRKEQREFQLGVLEICRSSRKTKFRRMSSSFLIGQSLMHLPISGF